MAGRGFATVADDHSPIVGIKSVATCDSGARYYGRNDTEAVMAAYYGEGLPT